MIFHTLLHLQERNEALARLINFGKGERDRQQEKERGYV